MACVEQILYGGRQLELATCTCTLQILGPKAVMCLCGLKGLKFLSDLCGRLPWRKQRYIALGSCLQSEYSGFVDFRTLEATADLRHPPPQPLR